MNAMIKVTNKAGEITYFSIPEQNANKFIELIGEFEATYEVYPSGQMPLEALPEEISTKAKDVLKAFSEVSVTFERGQFTVSTGIGIYAHYAYDHCVCGRYKQEAVYTKEERRQNFIDEFGYAPCYL